VFEDKGRKPLNETPAEALTTEIVNLTAAERPIASWIDKIYAIRSAGMQVAAPPDTSKYIRKYMLQVSHSPWFIRPRPTRVLHRALQFKQRPQERGRKVKIARQSLNRLFLTAVRDRFQKR
jgi:hypothetical protein